MTNINIRPQPSKLGCTVRAGSSHPDIRTGTSNIRKNLCAKCFNPLPVTIKKEIECPFCGTLAPNN